MSGCKPRRRGIEKEMFPGRCTAARACPTATKRASDWRRAEADCLARTARQPSCRWVAGPCNLQRSDSYVSPIVTATPPCSLNHEYDPRSRNCRKEQFEDKGSPVVLASRLMASRIPEGQTMGQRLKEDAPRATATAMEKRDTSDLLPFR